MKIGIDLDDVLLNFYDPFLAFTNARHGTSYRREQITSFYDEDNFGITTEESHKRIQDFYLSPYDAKMEPVEGAVEALCLLAKHHALYIITARPKTAKEKVTTWVQKHFPNAIKEIHFTRDVLGHSLSKKKSEICKELGIELFIDDASHNVHDVATLQIPVFLFDAPWNQSEVALPIERVHSWEHIVQKLA